MSKNEEEIKEELLVLLESTANLMRGMQFDSSIPGHAKGVLLEKVKEIDSVVSKHVE